MSRKNFNSLTKEPISVSVWGGLYGTTLKKKKVVLTRDAEEAFYFEFLFYAFENIVYRKEFNAKDAYSIFSNHDDIVFNESLYAERIKKEVVFLMKTFMNESNFVEALKGYAQKDSSHRLYDVDKFNVKRNSNVKFSCETRFEVMDEFILNIKKLIEHEDRKNRTVLSSNENVKVKIPFNKNNNSHNEVGGFIKKNNSSVFSRDDFSDSKPFKFTSMIDDRKNKKVDVTKIVITPETYKKMDEICPQSWLERSQKIEIRNVLSEGKIDYQNDFQLLKNNHILGGLGTGKTTLTSAVIFELVKERKGKVTILASSKEDCFVLKEKMKKLGIDKTAVIVGKGNKRIDRNNFLSSKINEEKSGLKVFEERKDIVETLDDTCIISKKMNDNAHLCDSINIGTWENPKYKICPLFESCGHNRMYKEMLEADIWITTYEAATKTSIPYYWDKYERNTYELICLWSDLIIIDEADKAQTRFEALFTNEVKLSIATNSKVGEEEKYFIDYLTKMSPYVDKNKNIKPLVYQYSPMIAKAQENLRYMFSNILNKEEIESKSNEFKFSTNSLLSYFIDKFYTLKKPEQRISDTNCFRSLRDEFSLDKEKRENVKDPVRRYLEDLSMNTDLSPEEKEVKKRIVITEEISTLEERFSEEVIPKQLKNEFSKRKKMVYYELLLFFFEFDFYTTLLRSKYQKYAEEVVLKNDEKYSKEFNFPRNSHANYVSDALTKNIYAYTLKYSTDRDNKQNISIEQVYYYAVGRNFFENLSTSFDKIEEYMTPAIIALSATSDTENSSKYKLNQDPTAIIINKTQNEGTLKLNLDFFVDNGEIIRFSGEPPERKLRNLEILAKKMISEKYLQNMTEALSEEKAKKEEEALSHFKVSKKTRNDRDKYLELKNESKRITMIVLKSYEKVEFFTKKLIENGISEDKIKCLVSGKDRTAEKENYHIYPHEIEDLYKYNIDYFVAVGSVAERGHNILCSSTSQKALIKNIVFVERPFPYPDDFKDVVGYTHLYQKKIKDKIKNNGLNLSKALGSLRQESTYNFDYFFNEKITWANSTYEVRTILSCDELVSFQQLVGRAIRGGEDMEMFLIDRSFAPLTAEKNSFVFLDDKKDSMLGIWIDEIQNNHKETHKIVNKRFIEAFDKEKITITYR